MRFEISSWVVLGIELLDDLLQSRLMVPRKEGKEVVSRRKRGPKKERKEQDALRLLDPRLRKLVETCDVGWCLTSNLFDGEDCRESSGGGTVLSLRERGDRVRSLNGDLCEELSCFVLLILLLCRDFEILKPKDEGGGKVGGSGEDPFRRDGREIDDDLGDDGS